jgi:hypothetical protein
MRLLAGFVAALLVATAMAELGGDVSEFYDESVWQCAKKKGWNMMSARSYCSYGAVDPNGKKTVAAAKAAGFGRTDIYHFPCPGISAKKQIQDDINYVGLGNFNTIWMDIETNPSSGCGWPSDQSKGCKFLEELIHEAKAMGADVGVYASEYEWGQTVGAGCKAGGDLKLWYANYDGQKSFGDFSPFGGWTKPWAKQYADTVGNECGLNADADWRP